MAHIPTQTTASVQQQVHLFHSIYVLLDDGDRRVLQPFGLTITQYRVLQALNHDEGQRLTTISERLIRAKSTITRIVDQLEAEDLVMRCSDDDDRRAQRVRLTPAGKALLDEATLAQETMINDRFNIALNDEDQQVFCALLEKMHDSFVETMTMLGDGDASS